MNNSYSRLMTLGVLAAATPLSFSQTPPETAQGPASGLASAVVFRGTAGDVRVKPPGAQTTQPSSWGAIAIPGSGPDFSHAALFGSNASLVDVDAISTGNDVIPQLYSVTDTSSQIAYDVPNLVATGRWLGVVISVKDGDPGAGVLPGEPLPLITRAMNGNRSNGSDLFSYYYHESTAALTASVAGQTLVEQTREAMGFTYNSPDDVAGLDYGLGVRAFSPGMTEDPMFPTENMYYFSITAASASALNASPAGGFVPVSGTGPALTAHGGTIYRLDWTGSAWNGPFLHLDYTALSLGVEDDIDALAVDPEHYTTVFSTVRRIGGPPSQLMIYDQGYSSPPVPLRTVTEDTTTTTNVEEVTHLLGLGDVADIDAVCILDPDHHEYSFHFGTPVGELPSMGQSPPMGLSVTLTKKPNVNAGVLADSRLHIELSGHRGTLSTMTTVVYMYAPNYDTLIPWDDEKQVWDVLGSAARWDTGTNFDNVIDYQVPVSSLALGDYTGFCAIVFDSTGAIIGGSTVNVLQIQ